MKEIWKDLIYRNIYYGDRIEVSNLGRLRNKKTKYVYKLVKDKKGYLGTVLTLGSKSKVKKFFIHKAVADTFIPNPNNKSQVNHIDGNKTNNCVENLEWVTNKENCIHAIKNNLHLIYGESNPSSKLDIEKVRYIRNNYIPKSKEYGCRALAIKFNVSHATISAIIHNKIWNIPKSSKW